MSRVCQVTGKRHQTGCKVSHANNHSNRRFEINLQTKRFWVPEENRFVKIRVTAHGMKIINRRGISAVLTEMKAAGFRG